MNKIEKEIKSFLIEQIQNDQSFIMIRNNISCMNIGHYNLDNINIAIFLYNKKKFDQISIIQFGSSNKLSLIHHFFTRVPKKSKLIFKNRKDSYSFITTLDCFKKINNSAFIDYYSINLPKEIIIEIFNYII